MMNEGDVVAVAHTLRYMRTRIEFPGIEVEPLDMKQLAEKALPVKCLRFKAVYLDRDTYHGIVHRVFGGRGLAGFDAFPNRASTLTFEGAPVYAVERHKSGQHIDASFDEF